MTPDDFDVLSRKIPEHLAREKAMTPDVLERLIRRVLEAGTPSQRKADALLALATLCEQLEAARATTQKWYDEAHEQNRRANRAEADRDALREALRRARHELDKFVLYPDVHRVARAQEIIDAALDRSGKDKP